MPKSNVRVPREEFEQRCQRHYQVLAGLAEVDPKLQKLIAELMLIRLFDELQEAISGIALRLASGAKYCDGSTPALLVPSARSAASARNLFECQDRVKRRPCKWSRVSFINETTKYVLDESDNFREAIGNYALIVAEMQKIRNRIAHANASSRREFQKVVRNYYGAARNQVTPGLLLVSPRNSPTLISAFVTASRMLVRDCAGA